MFPTIWNCTGAPDGDRTKSPFFMTTCSGKVIAWNVVDAVVENGSGRNFGPRSKRLSKDEVEEDIEHSSDTLVFLFGSVDFSEVRFLPFMINFGRFAVEKGFLQ